MKQTESWALSFNKASMGLSRDSPTLHYSNLKLLFGNKHYNQDWVHIHVLWVLQSNETPSAFSQYKFSGIVCQLWQLLVVWEDVIKAYGTHILLFIKATFTM